MRLPAAATKDEHAARSERTAAKQARRCGVYAGDARVDEEDDGTDPAFAFARSPRVVGITAAAASRRAALVPLPAPIREEPEVENATGGGGGSGSRPTESPPPPGVHSRVRGPPGAPGDEILSSEDRDAGRFGRGVAFEARAARPPGALAPPPSSAAPRGWARRDRVMVPPHARHQPRLAADRWHAPSASRDTHLPKLPGRERAGGVPRGPRGGYWENERIAENEKIAENARRGNDRVARLDAPRGGGVHANHERPKPRPSPRFHPPPRVDDARRRAPRPRVASEREREVARLREEVAALPSLRDARAMGGGHVAFGDRVDDAFGAGGVGMVRVGGAAAEATAARAREARAREARVARLRRDRAGGALDPPRNQPPSGYQSALDAYAPRLGGDARARGGVRGARGMRHHELQARFRAAPAVRRG